MADRILFSDTATDFLQRVEIFRRVVAELDLFPIHYVAVKNEHQSSRTANEMHDDMLTCRAIFIYLGRSTFDDNLALAIASTEGAHLLAKIFVYCEPGHEMRIALKSCETREVATLGQFEHFLRQDISSLAH